MPTGTLATYDLTVGVKLDFEDMIHLLSPTDVPVLNGSDASGLSAITKDSCFEKKVEWQDEEILLPNSTLNGAVLSGDSTIDVATGEGIRFGVGDVLTIEDEYLRVTARSTDTLTVTRGFGASSAADHDDGDAVVGVGKALPEGSDPETARALDRTGRHNFTQIFGPEKVEVSGSEQAVAKYGIDTTEFDHQVANRIKEAAIALDQAIVYGQRFEDTSNEWRTMGGMVHYIQTHVDSTTTSITPSTLLDQVQNAYDDGGNPDRLLTGSLQKRNISDFDSSDIRLGRGDNVRGQVVEWFDTDFGRLHVVLDRWVRSTDVVGYERDQSELNTLRPLMFEMLAKTGDSVKGQVLCEKTLKFYRERHAFRFSALT